MSVAAPYSGAKQDPHAASAIDQAERDAGRKAVGLPEQQKRAPALAAHIADAARATKRQAPPNW